MRGTATSRSFCGVARVYAHVIVEYSRMCRVGVAVGACAVQSGLCPV